MLVLGSIIRRGVSHGYGVYSDIASWRAETWTNVKPGSIYHALESLESQGKLYAVESENGVKLGPSRTEYAASHEGRALFEQLLQSALTDHDIQHFAVGIAFIGMLPVETAAARLRERAVSLEQSAAFLKTLPANAGSDLPSESPELIGLWVNYVETQAAYTRRLLEQMHGEETNV